MCVARGRVNYFSLNLETFIVPTFYLNNVNRIAFLQTWKLKATFILTNVMLLNYRAVRYTFLRKCEHLRMLRYVHMSLSGSGLSARAHFATEQLQGVLPETSLLLYHSLARADGSLFLKWWFCYFQSLSKINRWSLRWTCSETLKPLSRPNLFCHVKFNVSLINKLHPISFRGRQVEILKFDFTFSIFSTLRYTYR